MQRYEDSRDYILGQSHAAFVEPGQCLSAMLKPRISCTAAAVMPSSLTSFITLKYRPRDATLGDFSRRDAHTAIATLEYDGQNRCSLYIY